MDLALVLADPELFGQGEAFVQRTQSIGTGRIGHAGSRGTGAG